jgi:uncharacterized protein (TIGR02757 family)
LQLESLKGYLDAHVVKYNHTSFIEEDPVSIPHQFTIKQDREIIGLWIALLSWGNRKSILQSGTRLKDLMDGTPYDFVKNHSEKERERFQKFVHRTFNGDDAFYFLEFFQNYYREYKSLESAFAKGLNKEDKHVGPALVHFRAEFIKFANGPKRTLKHIATPESNSRCKRLLMFLRWMVRKDENKVDFGIWTKINPSQLLIPLDVHVGKIARQLGMLNREQSDWKAVLELSQFCVILDPVDPVKYDFALFGLGLSQKKIPSRLDLRIIS